MLGLSISDYSLALIAVNIPRHTFRSLAEPHKTALMDTLHGIKSSLVNHPVTCHSVNCQVADSERGYVLKEMRALLGSIR